MVGYHMRKTFGPPEAPPSRADSFVGMPGYQDRCGLVLRKCGVKGSLL